MKLFLSATVFGLVAALTFPASDAQAQGTQKIYKSISTTNLESLLRGMNITYKKTTSKKKVGTYYYDFTNRDNFKLRLGLHDNGQILWVDALFPLASLDVLNKWNRRAKFGRAVLENQAGKQISIVEWQLDLLGGSTDEIIRAYLRQFDVEVRNFSKFLRDNQNGI